MPDLLKPGLIKVLQNGLYLSVPDAVEVTRVIDSLCSVAWQGARTNLLQRQSGN